MIISESTKFRNILFLIKFFISKSFNSYSCFLFFFVYFFFNYNNEVDRINFCE